MSSRIKYCLGGAVILMLVGLLVVLISERSVSYPMPPGKWHLEWAGVDDNAVHWGTAVPGSYPKKYYDIVPAPHDPYPYVLQDPFPSFTRFITGWYPNYTPFKLREEIPENPLQIVVNQKLPDASYAAMITNNHEVLTLPLLKQAEGIYATPPFILLTGDQNLTEYKGMKVEMWNGPSPDLDTEIYKIVTDKP